MVAPDQNQEKSDFFYVSQIGREWITLFETCMAEGLGNKGKPWKNNRLAKKIVHGPPDDPKQTDPEVVGSWLTGDTVPTSDKAALLYNLFFADGGRPEYSTEFMRKADAAYVERKKLLKEGKIDAISRTLRRKYNTIVERSLTDCVILGTDTGLINPKDVRFAVTGGEYFVSPEECFQRQFNALSDGSYDYAPRNISFDGGGDFSDLVEATGISDLQSRIREGAEIAAKKVIDCFNDPKRSIKPYNKKKFGVRKIAFGVPHDKGLERLSINIELFTTDFFTDRVMREVYWKLAEEGHPIANIGETAPFLNGCDYSCFFTSLGLNADLVLLDNAPKIAFTRTALLANENQAYRWHVAMNEALNLEDVQESGEVLCQEYFKRGFQEELGLSEEFGYPGHESHVLSLALTRTNLELCIHGRTKLSISEAMLAKARLKCARDRIRESTGIEVIPYRRKAIMQFLVGNREFVTYAPAIWDNLIKRRCP